MDDFLIMLICSVDDSLNSEVFTITPSNSKEYSIRILRRYSNKNSEEKKEDLILFNINTQYEIQSLFTNSKLLSFCRFTTILKLKICITCKCEKTKRTLGGKNQKAAGFQGLSSGIRLHLARLSWEDTKKAFQSNDYILMK